MKYNTVWPETEAEIDPQIASAIRAGIRHLDHNGARNYGDYWVMELHDVDGSPIAHRWNSGTLARIESDVMHQCIATKEADS